MGEIYTPFIAAHIASMTNRSQEEVLGLMKKVLKSNTIVDNGKEVEDKDEEIVDEGD